ncbi:hypothetical protein ATO45_20285 [Escherichia coli]|nr:hypothetical protein ATO45_20285 [Escherichia coli]STI92171.1 capsid morphogenesis protein from phage [Escherichia coli]
MRNYPHPGERWRHERGWTVTINDPDTVLKDFIHKHITRPALANDAMPEQDPVFKLAGVAPDYAARLDFSNQLSPAAMHKIKVRQELAEKEKAV